MLPSVAGRLNAELPQLARIDRRRRFGQHANRLLTFRKSDHIAERRRAGENHGQPVDAEGDAAVRRRAVTQRFEEKAELGLGLLAADAEQLENAPLHLPPLDTPPPPPPP